MPDKGFKIRFRECRKAKGLTQERAALLLGVDHSTVAKWETGVAFPRAILLWRIAELYGCSVSDLLPVGGEGVDLEQYLKELLGPREAVALKRALAEGRTIIVTGAYGSGRSTLAATLRQFGYHAVEDFETYQVVLEKPLDRMLPNMRDRIFSSSARETSEKY